MWLITDNSIKGRWWLPSNLGRGESYEFVCACGSSMHQKCSNYALSNLFGLCRSVWIIDSFIICPNSHLRISARPFTPEILGAKKRIPFLSLLLFSPLNSHLNLMRSLGVHQPRWHDPNLGWHTPKLVDKINYESKGQNIGKIRNQSTLLGLQHFGGRRAWWSFEMGTKMNDKWVNYSHKPNNKLISA